MPASASTAGSGPCVVPCGPGDEPLRPAILYGVDTRASAEVEELTELFGEAEILRRCGSALSSQALGPKLLWLRRNEPDVYAATVRWHMASSYAVARLTGEWVLDHHSASQCDPLYDLKELSWNREWAELVVPGLRCYSTLVWPATVVGKRARSRRRSDRAPLEGTPVIAGTIDSWAEAVSVGVRAPGELMLQYGSTLFLILGASEPLSEPSVWTTCGVDPGSWTVAAGTCNIRGPLVTWIRVDLHRPDVLLPERGGTAPPRRVGRAHRAPLLRR